MAHLIDKSAILAEIESLEDKGKYHEEYDCAYRDGNNSALYALKGKFNTLEVKEMDLEKEYKEYVEEDPVYNKLVNGIVGKNIAKHFFELGLRASNPLTWEDISVIRQTMAEYRREENHERNNEDFCKEVLKRFKAKKGEKV